MRCDYPRDFDEDFLEPASDTFIQFVLQNAQPIGNEGLNQGDEGAVNANENEGNINFPMILPLSDDSLSPLDSYASLEPSSLSLHQEHFFEIFNDMSENGEESCNTENDSTDVYQLVDETTDALSEDQQSDRSSTVNSQNSGDADDILDVVSHETDDCSLLELSLSKELSQETDDLNLPECGLSKKLSHSNETSHFVDSSVQTDIPPNINLASSTSNYASLFVTVPPISLPSQSDNLLSEVLSDRLLAPVNSPCSSLINETVPSEDDTLEIVDEICNNEEDISSDSVPDTSSFFAVAEKDEKHHNLSELDSALDIENTVSSDTGENSYPEFVTLDAVSSEEVNINQEGNASCVVTSDNSVPNLKRKIISSVDDDSINKVPKFSVSQESNESINKVFLDNNSSDSSSDAKMPVFCDEDEIDIGSSSLDDENVFIVMDDC